MISMLGAKFFTLDIKNFYLNTPLKWYEHLWLRLVDILEDFIEEYNLKKLADGE